MGRLSSWHRANRPNAASCSASVTPTTDYTYNADTGDFATVAGAITVPAATYTQDPTTGAYSVTPGSAILTVTGTV